MVVAVAVVAANDDTQNNIVSSSARNNADKRNTINIKLMPIYNQLTEQNPPQKFFLISLKRFSVTREKKDIILVLNE